VPKASAADLIFNRNILQFRNKYLPLIFLIKQFIDWLKSVSKNKRGDFTHPLFHYLVGSTIAVFLTKSLFFH
jgi:hypothetical protein